MRTLAATHPQQLFWLLLPQCHLSVPPPREMTALLALELCSNVTYRQPGDIRQRCSLCRCSLHCESIPGHVNNLEYYGNYLKCYIETGNDMRYVRTYTVRTNKFSIEHTSVGLAHARPINQDRLNSYW